MNAEPLLKIEEVAKQCKVSVRTVRTWAESEELQSIRISPRLLRFDQQAVRDFLRNHQKGA